MGEGLSLGGGDWKGLEARFWKHWYHFELVWINADVCRKLSEMYTYRGAHFCISCCQNVF